MRIEGFRSLNSEIETIVNKSEAVKKAKRDGEKLTTKEKKELSEAEKEYKSKRKMIQEKLIKFATRVPVFMYLTDYREYSLQDVITQLEPDLFKKVTGLDVRDFELLVSLNVFNEALMNDAVYKFKRYEDADAKIKEVFQKFPAWRKRTLGYDNWGTDHPDWGYWWGSNMVIAQCTLSVLLGSILTEGADRIPDEVILSNESAFNYLLGVNPVSFCYVSGYGENCVRNIYSAIYSRDAKLDPYRCPAGYVTEGTNPNNNRQLSKYDGKCYMDSDAEWTTNENTIYGNAAMIFLTAAIMSRIQTEQLRGDVNADGKFDFADAVLLQKWLLAVPDTELKDWKAADFCADNRLDATDLCRMKHALLR